MPYDDSTKMYVGPNGVISPDYSNVPTQKPGLRFECLIVGPMNSAQFDLCDQAGPGPDEGMGGGGDEPPRFYSEVVYVTPTAEAIESAYPGSVTGANIPIMRGTAEVAEFDIETPNYVIQVKSGSARGLGAQIRDSRRFTTKTVIGYAPDLAPDAPQILAWAQQGWAVYTSVGDLLWAIAP